MRVSTYERIDSDDAERQVWRLESYIRGMVQPHALPGVDAALSELDHQQQLRGLSYEEGAWHAVRTYLVEHGHGAVWQELRQALSSRHVLLHSDGYAAAGITPTPEAEATSAA